MIRSLRKAVLFDLEDKLRRAFGKVGSDIDHLNTWVRELDNSHNQLHSHHSEHVNLTRKDVATLNKWIQYLHRHHSDMRTQLTEVTKYLHENASISQTLLERLKKIESESQEMRASLLKLKEKSEKMPEVRGSVRTGSRTRFEPEPEYSGSQTRFEQKVVKKVMQNKRTFVVNEMLRLITAQHPTTKELEKVIVEEKELCGRTTFYSYLKDLRNTGQVVDERRATGIVLAVQNK